MCRIGWPAPVRYRALRAQVVVYAAVVRKPRRLPPAVVDQRWQQVFATPEAVRHLAAICRNYATALTGQPQHPWIATARLNRYFGNDLDFLRRNIFARRQRIALGASGEAANSEAANAAKHAAESTGNSTGNGAGNGASEDIGAAAALALLDDFCLALVQEGLTSAPVVIEALREFTPQPVLSMFLDTFLAQLQQDLVPAWVQQSILRWHET